METGIIGRLNLTTQNPRGRLYVHTYGLGSFANIDPDPKFTGISDETGSLVSKAFSYGEQLYKHACSIATEKCFEFMMGIVWGEHGNRMVDFFAWSGLNPLKKPGNWPGNPEIYSFVLRNGVLVPEGEDFSIKQIGCGDGIILVGEEEKYRRSCTNLDDFTSNPPQLDEFGDLEYDLNTSKRPK